MSEWHLIEDEPFPDGGMIIWAFWDRTKKVWQVGLAYKNVSGGWSDAYAIHLQSRWTHWHPMPDPPSHAMAAIAEKEGA